MIICVVLDVDVGFDVRVDVVLDAEVDVRVDVGIDAVVDTVQDTKIRDVTMRQVKTTQITLLFIWTSILILLEYITPPRQGWLCYQSRLF